MRFFRTDPECNSTIAILASFGSSKQCLFSKDSRWISYATRRCVSSPFLTCPFLSQQFNVLIGSGCFATEAHLGDGRDSLHFELFFRQMRFELSLRSVGKEKRDVQVMPCQTISSIKCYAKYSGDGLFT